MDYGIDFVIFGSVRTSSWRHDGDVGGDAGGDAAGRKRGEAVKHVTKGLVEAAM